MSQLMWTDDLSIGIDSIDDQHKILFGLIDQLQEAMSRGESRSVLGDIFQGLVDYTEKHFKHEEELFEKYGYSEAAEHNKKHKDFVKEMETLYQQFNENTNFMIGVDVMKFLTDWLVSHIQGTDRQYAPYMIEKGLR